MPPGWKKEWHVGIRSGAKLCAFISAIPTDMRVRKNTMASAEVNFLCIHKKLRGKRLAPVLIKEITRRVNLEGVWQAIYTGGVVLPKPVSTCRYYHRAINWKKLYEVGFSPCPSNSKPEWQVRRYALPENTTTRGLRPMQPKDLDAVHDLLGRYLKRFDITPVWNKVELEHWLLQKMDPSDSEDEQILWSFVVEVSACLYFRNHNAHTGYRMRTERLPISSPSTFSSRRSSSRKSTTRSAQRTCSTTRPT
jgi:glycylpeptide N-tetradecanoyltransferase